MVLALLLIGLFIVPIPYYIEGPGTTENLKEFVTVDGKKIRSLVLLFNNGGHSFGHYFFCHKSKLFGFSRSHVQKLMGDSSNSEYNRIQQYYMDSSKTPQLSKP